MNDATESTLSAIAETHPVPARERLLQQVLQRTGAQALPSGILQRTSPRHSRLHGVDGSADARPLGQQEWEECLAELDRGRLAGATPLCDQVGALAREFHERGQVPVFIADIAYEAVRGRVWAAIERLEQAGAADDLPFMAAGDLVESRRAFLASAVLAQEFAAFVAQPLVHYGQEVQFVFPAGALLGDAAGATGLQVDFGDGAGFRPVQPGEVVHVRYAGLGSQLIALQLPTAAGLRMASFDLMLVESPLQALSPEFVREERAPVWATIRRPGIKVTRAQAYVLRQRNRPRITRPLLMVEGFPGNYPWDVSFRYANQQGFAARLFERGYDIVLVRFPDGPERLEANAYALIALMQSLIAEREGSEPLVVGGFSMGGVIARYALAYMEHERRTDPRQPHHQTRKLFTIDSPHEGANLAVSVQAVAQALRGDGAEAKLMRTDAAQQLLLTWINPLPWHDGQRFGPSPLRLEFLRELERVGSMPRELEDTIAIADGAGNGQRQSTPGALATKFACGPLFYADYHTEPLSNPGAPVMQVRNFGFGYRIVSGGGLGVDSAPGGVWEAPIFRRAYDAAAPAFRELAIENSCFIPTHSALAITDRNYFRVPDLGQSKFRSVTYSHEGNLTHVKLTPTLSQFLLHFITRPAGDTAVAESAAEALSAQTA